MRKLNKLDIDSIDIFDKCVSKIRDQNLLKQFTNCRKLINTHYKIYSHFACTHQLHNLTSFSRGDPAQFVVGGLRKKELIDLYQKEMLPKGKVAREFYNKIKMLAPNETCPYCGIGIVTTVDHFLAKANYPLFAIMPDNLVPACKDCNEEKGDAVITSKNLMSHPYFEESCIEEEVWLHAHVLIDKTIIAHFYVDTPKNWSRYTSECIINYFNNLNLAHRYRVQASSEIASLLGYINHLKSRKGVQEHLNSRAKSESDIRKNTWRAALYNALSKSNEFIEYCI